MAPFIEHRLKNVACLALWIGIVVASCAQVDAQLSAAATATSTQAKRSTEFEFSGTVTSKSASVFEVRNGAGESIAITVTPSTDFAMRLSSPWFNGVHRKVAVNGKTLDNGKRQRITYSLPSGQLYLLVQFRSIAQRDRIMKQPILRLNNYLISDRPIEPAIPVGKELLLAGELDLKTSSLTVGEKSWPITLGYRNATLRGRSHTDIVAGETVVLVTGSESEGSYIADTVLFRIR